MGDGLTDKNSLLAAQVLAAFLYAGETLHPDQNDILDKGMALHSITTHHPISGTPDVAADITMNCGSLKALFDIEAINPQIYTKEANAAFDLFIKNGGELSIEHPAAEMNKVTLAQLTNIFADAAQREYSDITADHALSIGEEYADEYAQNFADKLVTTEEQQRAFAADNDRPYVARARLACLVM